MTKTNRIETHTRTENLRLVKSVVGRRSWEDDQDNAGGIVTQYPDLTAARQDAARLEAAGLEVSTSEDDDGAGWLWVIVGEES